MSIRDASPSKAWRPSTAYSPSKKGNKSILNNSNLNESAIQFTGSVFTYPGVNIIRELTGKEIKSQDKDIEIERLKTTCFNLNNKAIVSEDLLKDIQILKARLQESENARMESEKNRMESENARNNLETENRSLRQELQSTLDKKSILQKDLEQAADFNITMEEKVYKSNKISLDLINQLKIAEMELGYVYVPVKTDNIDCRLAEYINWSTARPALKSLFTRESEGVYQFGSKRCNVKWEINKLMVRVGGGYLKIDEFVEQYLPIELEKLGHKLDSSLYYSNQVIGSGAYVPASVLRKSISPNKSMVQKSPRREASPNTRASTQIRQSVSLKYM